MSNKLLLVFALIGIIVVFSCGLFLPIPIGYRVSMLTAGVIMSVVFSIIIPFDRKHIVRKKGNKIDFTKTKVYFRWNVFDTISVCLALYACICVQVLIFFSSNGIYNSKSICSIFYKSIAVVGFYCNCIFNFPYFINVKRNKGDQKSWRRLGLRRSSCLRIKGEISRLGKNYMF